MGLPARDEELPADYLSEAEVELDETGEPLSFRAYTVSDPSMRVSRASVAELPLRHAWVPKLDLKQIGITIGIVVGATFSILFAVLIAEELGEARKPSHSVAAAQLASSPAPSEATPLPKAALPASPVATVLPAAAIPPPSVAAIATPVARAGDPAKRPAGKKGKPKAKLAFRNADAIFNP